MNNSISIRLLTALFLVCTTQASLASQASPRTRNLAPQMRTVDWVDQEIACGRNAADEKFCVGDQSTSIFVSQAIGKIKSTVSNDLAGCAFDEDGLKCWRLPTENNAMVDGLPIAEAIPSLLKRLNPESIRTSLQNICGIETSTGNLICYVPAWDRLARRMFRTKPTKAIGVIAVSENKICWQDDANINCRDSDDLRSTIAATAVTDIAFSGTSVCARSATEATCWISTGPVTLPPEFLNAKTWYGSDISICALTDDSRLSCFEPNLGGPPSFGPGSATPPRFLTAGSDLVDYWNDHQYGMLECALLKDQTVSCWSFYDKVERKLIFRGPVTALVPKSNGAMPCAYLQSGQIECRNQYEGGISLAKGSTVDYKGRGSGRCSWNSSGAICTHAASIPLTDLTALTMSHDTICVAGKDGAAGSASVIGVWCTEGTLPTSRPLTLANPILLAISEGSQKVCAASDGALQCGGAPFAGAGPPATLDKPSKLLIAESYGCVLDLYGLVCWGDLKGHGLEIPTGLNSPTRVRDFALGTESICAVLDDGSAQCWGAGAPTPPKLSGANSIAGYGDSFCATDHTGLHCWGGNISLPE